MGTWDTGLWDNDSSLDALRSLIAAKVGPELLRALAVWGLKLWFGQCEVSDFNNAVSRKSKEVRTLPKPLFETFAEMIARPAELKGKSRRSAEHRAAIGGYCDGYRIDPLFSTPPARALAAEVATRCAVNLDRTFASTKSTLYDASLTELGVLLELSRIGLYPTAAQRERWRSGFVALDARTTEERGFWDEFKGRVAPAFDLLVPAVEPEAILRRLAFYTLGVAVPSEAAAFAAKSFEAESGTPREPTRVALDAALSGALPLAPLLGPRQTEAQLRDFFAAVSGALTKT